MNDKLKYGLIGFIIGAMATWFITLNIAGESNFRMGEANVSQQDSIDAHFIEQMIPHHQDAITMAKLAQTKAHNQELKQLADNIIDSQGKEINMMKDWYKDWFNQELPSGKDVMEHHGMESGVGMHMGTTGTKEDYTSLAEAENFDRAFVEHMIPHHQMAVMMANMLKEGSKKPEMKKLADDIINAQTDEIEKMRDWLKEWK